MNGVSSQSQVSLEQEGRQGASHTTSQRGISYQSPFIKNLEEDYLNLCLLYFHLPRWVFTDRFSVLPKLSTVPIALEIGGIYTANMEREGAVLGTPVGIFNFFRLISNLLCFLSDSLEDECQKMACECDREAAKCFSKAPYHRKYLLWPDFLCGEIQPLCRY